MNTLTDVERLEALLAPPVELDEDEALGSWATSGAMWLTGHRDGPALAPPEGLVASVERLGRSIRDLSHHAQHTTNWSRSVSVDALALLTERAAIAGLRRDGRVSCGGSTRLLRCRDGRWIAVSLARPSDIDAIPAWLGIDPEPESMWHEVTVETSRRHAADVVAQAVLLSLPVAALDERLHTDRPAVAASRVADASPRRSPRRPLVIDLSSLWAGPLCGHLLHAAGAEVIKVESISRPDGARSGPAAFFSMLNAGKTMVALDLSAPKDVSMLAQLLTEADVVIEASRPRALAQLGLTASSLPATRDRVWVTITGHGTLGVDEITANRVGFGDDAAVAGGCVAMSSDGPVFCADAIADPLAGLAATATTLAALAEGGTWTLDVALSSVAAWASRDAHRSYQMASTDAPTPIPLPPRSRQSELTARPLGADNQWLDRFDRSDQDRT